MAIQQIRERGPGYMGSTTTALPREDEGNFFRGVIYAVLLSAPLFLIEAFIAYLVAP